MKSNDRDFSEAPAEEPESGVWLQYSLLDYFIVFTLVAVCLMPFLRYMGVEGIAVFAGLALLIGWLTLSAHWFANWILTPRERRPWLIATIWFWVSAGIVL